MKNKIILVTGDPNSINSEIIYKSWRTLNSSVKKRKLYIDFAEKHDYSVRCIHLTTALDISYKRNKGREDKKQVPKIAFSVYKKHYEEPNEEEGFTLQTI